MGWERLEETLRMDDLGSTAPAPEKKGEEKKKGEDESLAIETKAALKALAEVGPSVRPSVPHPSFPPLFLPSSSSSSSPPLSYD